MTVYYRQFQTSPAHGLNIANEDSRQVPELQSGQQRQCVCVCVCVCMKYVVPLNLSSEEIVRLCVLPRQRDRLGSTGFEVRDVMRG